MKTNISEHFAELGDPQIEQTKLHPSVNIITISLCAIISGADDWVAIAAYGRTKQAFLSSFLNLSNGIPLHDTFRRVFGLLEPELFQVKFLAWVQRIQQLNQGKVVALDGKRPVAVGKAPKVQSMW